MLIFKSKKRSDKSAGLFLVPLALVKGWRREWAVVVCCVLTHLARWGAKTKELCQKISHVSFIVPMPGTIADHPIWSTFTICVSGA